MRKYRNKASQRVVLFSISRKKRERERERAKEEEGKAETQKNSLSSSSPRFCQREKKSKKKNRATCSLASASFTLKKHKKTGEKDENEREEREEERSGHHTSHARQHTISSWHSDKPWNSSPPKRPRSRLYWAERAVCKCTAPSSRGWNTRARTSGAFVQTRSPLISVNFRFGVPPFVFFLSLLFSYPFVTFHMHIA